MKKLDMGYFQLFTILAFCCFVSLFPSQSSAQEASSDLLVKLAQPGVHLIMRHALAPGTGDPEDFDLANCATQRNLNDAGKQQAADFGAYLQRHHVEFDRVLSSQWCRCMDTAKLMNMGKVEAEERLNSIWLRSQDYQDTRIDALKAFLHQTSKDQSLLMVTHYINILHLTGQAVTSGEGLVIKIAEDEIVVLGRTAAH